VTRDKILKRWVKQPPVGPNIQYLRDAERLSARDQLGERNRVLDIASESNVTAGLDADHVTRLDFSPDAIEYAREVLGTDVDRYEVTEPETPDLPFADDDFDGAVSIGPYDWKFLDVRGLTDELHRVVAPEGLLVFSVPTPWSPYATRNWNKYRYFTPREALALVSPDWRLADDDLVFQYPSYSHYAINSLPDRYQEPFVDLAWDLTDRLTARDWWGLASYLVCGVSPLSYSAYLDRALDCLFRPTDENGFWDPREREDRPCARLRPPRRCGPPSRFRAGVVGRRFDPVALRALRAVRRDAMAHVGARIDRLRRETEARTQLLRRASRERADPRPNGELWHRPTDRRLQPRRRRVRG
jgi:SAM-dependent methyltransferase